MGVFKRHDECNFLSKNPLFCQMHFSILLNNTLSFASLVRLVSSIAIMTDLKTILLIVIIRLDYIVMHSITGDA